MKLVATMLISACLTVPALAEADLKKGEKVFKKCMACHQIGEDAKNRVGPILTGVIGRIAGSVEGYKYGKHTKEAGEAGLVWTEEEIFN